MAIQCPTCHSDNPDTLKFCGECGAQLPLSQSRPPAVTETLRAPIRELATGSTFAGRYQVIEELGHGGMGKVYKVFDTDIREKIALKLLRPEIALDKETVERFSNELKLARRISHRNVCRMFDLGKAEGTTFITMEFVAGEDLKKLIRKTGQLGAGRAVSIAKQVCEGLAEAHRLGVVHRDLKPQNIMVDEDGNARIMDFGIARSLRVEGITGPGMMIGTPEYMSPEQVEGKDVDQRSDIYSLGIILYEMVTSRPPFAGDTALNIAMRHKTEIPKDPRRFNPQIPDELSRLILKCMEKEKEERYQRIVEILAALLTIESGTSTTAIAAAKGSDKEKRRGAGWRKSIAVLPFSNLSPEKEQEYFCDGLSEEIINALSHLRELRVVARTSAFAFKGKEIDIREVGEKLNVDAVLEGSVRKAGDRLRITAQLINVADGYHLWSERYDCHTDDIFDIQDNVTRAIIEKLKIEFLEEDKEGLARPHTHDMDAYDFYLRGRYFWSQRTEGGLMKAMDCFEQAIKLDPRYALAHTGLADSYIMLCWYGFLPPHQAYPKAKAAALRALEAAPGLAEAHTSLAYCFVNYDWDWLAAEKEFRQAIDSNRGYAFAHQGYFQSLVAMERMDEAMSEMKKAVELDPLSLGINSGLAWGFYFSRQYDRAIEQSRKTLELDPNFLWAQYVLGVSHITNARPAKTIEELKKSASFSELHPLITAVLGAAYAMEGDNDNVKDQLSRLMERAKHSYVMPFYYAIIHLGSGDKQKIFQWLEKAYDDRNLFLIFLKVDPMFDSLRSEPRFGALLKKIGLGK